MYAITGITGKVGGIVARTLLAAGLPVRAVVRDTDKGRPWVEKGCEVAIASIADADGLTKAFSGVDGVFLMTPPDFDPEPGFPKTHEASAAIKAAIAAAAQPGKVVFLSTVGAQAAEFSLLNNSKVTEEGLRNVSVPVVFLRAAWFMENASWDVEAAKAGVVRSFLQPLDRPIPMVATADIGSTAATCSATAGRVYVSSSSKGRAAIRRTMSPWALRKRLAIPCGWNRCRAIVGGAVPLAGNEASAGPHPHDRWIQRGLDRF